LQNCLKFSQQQRNFNNIQMVFMKNIFSVFFFLLLFSSIEAQEYKHLDLFTRKKIIDGEYSKTDINLFVKGNLDDIKQNALEEITRMIKNISRQGKDLRFFKIYPTVSQTSYSFIHYLINHVAKGIFLNKINQVNQVRGSKAQIIDSIECERLQNPNYRQYRMREAPNPSLLTVSNARGYKTRIVECIASERPQP
jgi:hypothetical protein